MSRLVALGLSVLGVAAGVIAYRRVRHLDHAVAALADVVREEIEARDAELDDLRRFLADEHDVVTEQVIATRKTGKQVETLGLALTNTIAQQEQQDREIRQLAANVGGVHLTRPQPKPDALVWFAPSNDRVH